MAEKNRHFVFVFVSLVSLSCLFCFVCCLLWTCLCLRLVSCRELSRTSSCLEFCCCAILVLFCVVLCSVELYTVMCCGVVLRLVVLFWVVLCLMMMLSLLSCCCIAVALCCVVASFVWCVTFFFWIFSGFLSLVYERRSYPSTLPFRLMLLKRDEKVRWRSFSRCNASLKLSL